jgi:hypothetical protein
MWVGHGRVGHGRVGHGRERAAVDGYGVVQLTPLGAVEPSPPATNPNVVDTPGSSEPLYGAFVTLTVPLVPVFTPFQRLLMVCPPASVSRTVQPLIAEAPACTVTSPWNPPPQLVTVRYVALHAPAGGVLAGGDDGGVVTGGEDGGVVTGGDDGGVVTGGDDGVPSVRLPGTERRASYQTVAILA